MSRAELLAELRELRKENAELQDRLEEIGAIAAPDDDGDDDDDQE